MTKKYLIIGLTLLFVLVALVLSGTFTSRRTVLDVKNMSYTVDGENFDLVNGKAEKAYSSDSASKNTLVIFGEPVYGDLDGDGDRDAAVLLANNTGGSGTFFYAVLVINNGGIVYSATNAMSIGDRIAPQTVEIHDGRAVFNYAVRRDDEPMSTLPSIGKSVWVNYDKKSGEIGEWVKDFEGESAAGLTEVQARIIAEKACIKGGEALSAGSHNKGTQTWWFDANLNATRPGCNPACVVDEKTSRAEINWRCTGLAAPK